MLRASIYDNNGWVFHQEQDSKTVGVRHTLVRHTLVVVGLGYELATDSSP